MSTKPSKNETLDRQMEPGNPLLDLLKGAVALMDETIHTLTPLVPLEHAEPLKLIRGFLTDMSEAGVAETMIIKVQRPLTSNMETPPYLVYNEDRSLMDHVTLEDPAIIDWFEGDPKMYVEARLWIDGTLQLLRRVEEQDW